MLNYSTTGHSSRRSRILQIERNCGDELTSDEKLSISKHKSMRQWHDYAKDEDGVLVVEQRSMDKIESKIAQKMTEMTSSNPKHMDNINQHTSSINQLLQLNSLNQLTQINQLQQLAQLQQLQDLQRLQDLKRLQELQRLQEMQQLQSLLNMTNSTQSTINNSNFPPLQVQQNQIASTSSQMKLPPMLSQFNVPPVPPQLNLPAIAPPNPPVPEAYDAVHAQEDRVDKERHKPY